MEALKIGIISAVSFVALFISSKLIGNKQMSELNLFDYINGITIGSIAAEMATDLEHSPVLPLVGIAVYTALVMLCNYISRKSIPLKRFLSGRSIILMQNGKLYKNNFKKGRIEISEFMTECRINGFFNLSDIELAVLEQNGKISIMPKSVKRPVNGEDLKLPLTKELPDMVIVQDGVILEENLKQTGNNNDWLNAQLKNLGFKNTENIFLAVCSPADNKLHVYKADETGTQNDFSQ